MNLVICHYHLQTGGVTRIIQSQMEAVRGAGCVDAVRVLAGAMPEGSPFAEPACVDGPRITIHPDLDYLPENAGPEECRRRHDALLSLLEEHTGPSDVLHVHNPNLGKNPVLSRVLRRLLDDGLRLVYHCHDFAEDRPENSAFNRRILEYLGVDPESDRAALRDVLYPRSSRCLYGVLTTHDIGRLVALGVDEPRIHHLPNPVTLSLNHPDDAQRARKHVCSRLAVPSERPIFLYPVRVIRRKNIGELLLIAALFRERASWLVTRAPHNPAERADYERWTALSGELELPVVFEAGHTVEFGDLMRAADRVVTTSVREGFGMSFLEPWLAGLPVVGRRLPEVIEDFTEAGMDFRCLYDGLPVEEEPGSPDFPELARDRQMALVREAAGSRETAGRLVRRWGLEDLLFGPIPHSVIERNREIVRNRYSVESYGRRLCRLYSRLADPARTPGS